MKNKILFKSNVNHLQKVLYQLNLSQNMGYTQIILGDRNKVKLNDAIQKLMDSIKVLNEIS